MRGWRAQLSQGMVTSAAERPAFSAGQWRVPVVAAVAAVAAAATNSRVVG